MEWNSLFFLNSLLLGVGLAMDAFSISLVNGLNEPDMKTARMCGIAGIFAFFQAIMPLTGWGLVHTIVQMFAVFEKFIPWIALGLLGYIGGEMLFHGLRHRQEEQISSGFSALLMQGVATSIDALSVGFTISEYGLVMAVVCALLIAAVTFFICLGGLMIGRVFGTKLSDKAEILGGIILILIGLEIWISALF